MFLTAAWLVLEAEVCLQVNLDDNFFTFQVIVLRPSLIARTYLLSKVAPLFLITIQMSFTHDFLAVILFDVQHFWHPNKIHISKPRAHMNNWLHSSNKYSDLTSNIKLNYMPVAYDTRSLFASVTEICSLSVLTASPKCKVYQFWQHQIQTYMTGNSLRMLLTATNESKH
jgi:hypothetical protein